MRKGKTPFPSNAPPIGSGQNEASAQASYNLDPTPDYPTADSYGNRDFASGYRGGDSYRVGSAGGEGESFNAYRTGGRDEGFRGDEYRGEGYRGEGFRGEGFRGEGFRGEGFRGEGGHHHHHHHSPAPPGSSEFMSANPYRSDPGVRQDFGGVEEHNYHGDTYSSMARTEPYEADNVRAAAHRGPPIGSGGELNYRPGANPSMGRAGEVAPLPYRRFPDAPPIGSAGVTAGSGWNSNIGNANEGQVEQQRGLLHNLIHRSHH